MGFLISWRKLFFAADVYNAYNVSPGKMWEYSKYFNVFASCMVHFFLFSVFIMEKLHVADDKFIICHVHFNRWILYCIFFAYMYSCILNVAFFQNVEGWVLPFVFEEYLTLQLLFYICLSNVKLFFKWHLKKCRMFLLLVWIFSVVLINSLTSFI